MRASVALLATSLTLATAPAQTITVTAGDKPLSQVVVAVPLSKDIPADANVVELPGSKFLPAQIAPPALGTSAPDKVLTFVLPELAANQSLKVRPGTNAYVKAPPQFKFVDKPGEYTDLLFDGRPVLRYINAPHDGSSKDRHDVTMKPFHHVYEPAKGESLLTSGAYPFSDKSKQFPHHRGLFYGFNRISYGDKKTADIWHGHNNVFSQHDKFLSQNAGEVFGRSVSEISWHGQDGQTFATEQRELTAYHTSGGTLIDFTSKLSTTLDKVRLDGDPQHAGFHFRATQEVSKDTLKETYYLRPDGKGKLGETRNWDPKGKDPKTINLPWNAMSFVTGGKRYTTLRINHPNNPKETRGSERDYGRFGDYFEYDMTPDKPLVVRYRVWVQEGEMTQEQCEALQQAFVHPPSIK